MNAKHRTFLMLLSALILILGLSASADEPANKYSHMLVFGDSISEGALLPGTIYTRESYGNIIADYLGLEQGNGYANYSVGGYLSNDILAMMKKHSDEIAEAELILATDGGNDVMSKMLEIVMKETQMTGYDLQGALVKLATGDTDGYIEKFKEAENVKLIDDAINTYRSVFTETTQFLRSTNKDAKIVFLTQYNPVSGIAGMESLYEYTEAVIVRLNEAMTEIAKSSGCDILDVHSLFEGKGHIMTNILMPDIHPSKAGHAAIAQAIKDEIINVAIRATEAPSTSHPSESPLQTTPQVKADGNSSTVYIISICSVCVIVLILFFVIKAIKKKS